MSDTSVFASNAYYYVNHIKKIVLYVAYKGFNRPPDYIYFHPYWISYPGNQMPDLTDYKFVNLETIEEIAHGRRSESKSRAGDR